jgi:hypothetical protein
MFLQNVHLVGSVPGAHPLTAAAGKRCVWGVQRMHDVLAANTANVPSTAPLVSVCARLMMHSHVHVHTDCAIQFDRFVGRQM